MKTTAVVEKEPAQWRGVLQFPESAELPDVSRSFDCKQGYGIAM